MCANVHLRNPAKRLHERKGFRVVGQGNGPLGLAMVKEGFRSSHRNDASTAPMKRVKDSDEGGISTAAGRCRGARARLMCHLTEGLRYPPAPAMCKPMHFDRPWCRILKNDTNLRQMPDDIR